MSERRAIAAVVRKIKLADLDEVAERRAYWATRTAAERIAEVEVLRRLWIEITGDPDQPIERVVFKRRLGQPAIRPPDKR
ncbi:MAG: hypothetical protein ACKV2T_42850 [Kofleriaceae bacterium]